MAQRRTRWWALGGCLLGLVAVMLWLWHSAPPEVYLHEADGYGENHSGDLRFALAVLALEVSVLVGVLRPWSYDAHWTRPLVALVPFAPWTLVAYVMTQHAGPVLNVVALSNFIACAVLGAMAVVDFAGTRAS